MRLQCDVEHQTDIADLRACQVFEHGYKIQELIVVCIREPAANRYGMLRMKDVRCGRVVDDYGLAQITPDLREIL